MKIIGTLSAWNISPKGLTEGFLLDTPNGAIQINLPKDLAGRLDRRLEPGDTVIAEADEEEPWGDPSHPVFHLARLVSRNGKKIEALASTDRFAGRVARLNYALHGEVNGAILDTGDFLHLKPEGARAVGLTLDLVVKGRGARKPMGENHFVIEAEEVNGISLGTGEKEHHHQKPAAKKHVAQPHAARKHARKP